MISLFFARLISLCVWYLPARYNHSVLRNTTSTKSWRGMNRFVRNPDNKFEKEMTGVLGHLCSHRRTSWGWWDEWDDTALQIHDSKFDSRRSEAEHATSQSRGFPTILNLYEWAKQAALTTVPGPPRMWADYKRSVNCVRAVFWFDVP